MESIHPSLCLFSLTSEIRFGPTQTRGSGLSAAVIPSSRFGIGPESEVIGRVEDKLGVVSARERTVWFNPGWQPQAQLGDGKAPKAAQPAPNPLDLRLPHTIELKINVTRNLTYLNPAEKTDLSIVSALSLQACRIRLLQVN